MRKPPYLITFAEEKNVYLSPHHSITIISMLEMARVHVKQEEPNLQEQSSASLISPCSLGS